MKKYSLICLSSALCLSVCVAVCPTDFLQLRHKCYYFSNSEEQWMQAHFKCKDRNSSLASFNRPDYTGIRQYLLKYLVPNEWWIGATYNWKQKLWTWAVSGKPLSFNAFMKKKPDQWDCAYLDPKYQYRWNSTGCIKEKNFICETVANSPDNDMPLIVSPFNKKIQIIHANRVDRNQAAYLEQRPIRKKSHPKYYCPKGYKHVRSMCYKFSKDRASWQDAYYNCDSEYNGTLAIVQNKRQDSALRVAAKKSRLSTKNRWIGGRYDWAAAAWKWAVNGMIIQHQAQDRDKLSWHCLVWSPTITNMWSSDNCTRKKYYICQTEITLIKFPTSQQSVRIANSPNDAYNVT